MGSYPDLKSVPSLTRENPLPALTNPRFDSNGDFSFGRGKQDYLTGSAAVAQAVKTRLLLLLAEWWEDQSDGTPLFQNIIGVSGTQENISAANLIIQDRIINTKGVTEVVEYINTYENRSCSVYCVINTEYSENTTVEVNFSGI